jgi:hypothetical protein
MTAFNAETIAVQSTMYAYRHLVGPHRVCSMCENEMFDEDQGPRDGMDGCDNCLAYCDRCERAVVSDDMAYVTVGGYGDYERWCASCEEDHAGNCGRCDETFPCADLTRLRPYGSPLCGTCTETELEEQEQAEAEAEEEASGSVIGDYHNRDRRAQTKPIHSAWSRANGFRLFGVELEVEAPEMRWAGVESVAGELLATVNDKGLYSPMMWAERDGSLSNGFELITQPMGLDRQEELWSKVLAHPSASGLRSHNTTTCGLHVHVSRTNLSQFTIAKAVVFLNDGRNADLVSAIARRYDAGYCKRKLVKLSKYAADPDRYVMLNTMPSQTIEFRLFKGSTRLETVIGCIEFANAVLNFCRDTAPANLTTKPFIDWLHQPANRLDSKNLRAVLARRAASLLESHLPKVNPRRVSTATASEE